MVFVNDHDAKGPAMSDKSILQHITELVEQERHLRAGAGTPEHNAEQLKRVARDLDQCWDLLRQRRALREFGGDPGSATKRDVKIVEGYEG